MERLTGTISVGVRAPIVRQGDDICRIVTDSVIAASESCGLAIDDRDVVGVTEAVVARSQGNYATVDNIASDIRSKFESDTVGVIFPILSRNRFAVCLKGIARGCRKIVLMLSFPSDEVGNHLIDLDSLDEKGITGENVLTEQEFRDNFGIVRHPFTNIDYIEYYKELILNENCEVEIILANDCRQILRYTDSVLYCDIHSRRRTKRILTEAGAKKVFGLDDILTAPVDGSGFNAEYGLLGSNKATEETVKLFPRNCANVVENIQNQLYERTGRTVEVLVYGDGAFKDPMGKIWELADPVVSPAYTEGLDGQPNELKLKYLADNDFADLSGDELKEAISDAIRKKDGDLHGKMESQGTTPRRLTDLIGSLCDLTSGSGDKGTPIVWIKGYFDNYTK